MGLDQYAFKVKNGEEPTEIAYWRKHNRLQGWMENLFRKDSGEGDFNCQTVKLDVMDLDNLEEAIVNKNLPETGGFFFGNDSYNEYEDKDFGYKDDDLAFLKVAREAMAQGYRIEYTSWY